MAFHRRLFSSMCQSNVVTIGLVGLLSICAYACKSAVLDNLASSSNRCCADFLWYPLDEELFQLSKPYSILRVSSFEHISS